MEVLVREDRGNIVIRGSSREERLRDYAPVLRKSTVSLAFSVSLR